MKKILILFLLSFPIIIFTIVTLTSSVIAYYVPLAVEGIEMIEGSDIADNDVGTTHNLEFQILPANARNMSFEIRDENDYLIVDYNQGETIVYNNLPDHIIEISGETLFIQNGRVNLNVKTNNIGFTRLTIITKDGNYRINSDIMVLDSNADPTEIQGVVLDYNKTNEDYLFGNKNEIVVGFTYFPKRAINASSEDETLINEALRENAKILQFNSTRGRLSNLKISDTDYGRGEITIASNSQTFEGMMTIEILINKLVKYEFNVKNGYNIYNEDDLFANNSTGANLFLLNHIKLNKTIVFRNGTNLYGNYFQIDHSNLLEYNERDENGKVLNVGKKAITFIGHNSGLHQVHIIGALDENQQPYENIVNVGMDAQGTNDKYMVVNDVIIENGRYNLSVRGKINSLEDDMTLFDLDKINLIGAYFASLEIDNHQHTATYSWATEVNISRLNIGYTAIGVLVQNNRNSNPGSKINLIEKEGIQAITSTSWRNLDDATGALSANNFGYIMNELKSEQYSDVYYKEGKNYYVNPVIMLRGGGRNRSEINFENDSTIDDLIMKERVPKGMIEVGIVGGTHPFVIYLLNPKYYKE
ncbi:hypothetical protein IY230_05275 [Acholeplasma laidlawii]|uniref:hypothetical protein n=1 Tax=Acholeplasma laidlawii TaxID=2148 RepID=UPI0018C2A9B6|nr:hypothetical protein [Acholeplasma laidlawii]MBG0763011.1 hypothetical protein [Acholeplasma laidlawii]